MSFHQQATTASPETMMMFMDIPSQQQQNIEIGGESLLKKPLHLEDNTMKSQQQQEQQQMIDELQEQVSYQNEIGKDLLRMGKTKTSLYHFSRGLQCIQRLSLIKKRIDGVDRKGSACASTASVLVPGFVLRLGRALPIDTLSTASSSEKWEVFSSLAIMHNSALAHYHDHSYGDAKQMLSLGVKLLRSDLSSPADLNRILKTNQYAATVVVSLYAMLGKTLLMLSPKNTKEAKKALTAAAGLQKRFLPNGGGSSRSLSSRRKEQAIATSVSATAPMQVCCDITISHQDAASLSPTSTVMSANNNTNASSVLSRTKISSTSESTASATAAGTTTAPYLNRL